MSQFYIYAVNAGQRVGEPQPLYGPALLGLTEAGDQLVNAHRVRMPFAERTDVDGIAIACKTPDGLKPVINCPLSPGWVEAGGALEFSVGAISVPSNVLFAQSRTEQ